MTDATFQDGAERSLKLRAFDGDDLAVISATTQDAVFPASQMTWLPTKRRFAILINRFRWEDVQTATAHQRPVERVQAVLAVEDVQSVKSMGIDKDDPDLVLSVLSLEFQAGADGTGQVIVTLSGDGAIQLAVEALEVTLSDVTRPYIAPSGQVPNHAE